MGLNAHYDITSKEIKGCEPNTLIYYHEEGHKHQHETGSLMFWNEIHNHCIYLSIGAIAYEINKTGLILLFCALFTKLVLELDAWIYAIKKYRRVNK